MKQQLYVLFISTAGLQMKHDITSPAHKSKTLDLKDEIGHLFTASAPVKSWIKIWNFQLLSDGVKLDTINNCHIYPSSIPSYLTLKSNRLLQTCILFPQHIMLFSEFFFLTINIFVVAFSMEFIENILFGNVGD